MNALDLAHADADPEGTTLDIPTPAAAHGQASDGIAETRLALVVLWWPSEPNRVGEVLFPRREPSWLGRASSTNEDDRLPLIRQRPHHNERTAPITDPFLSRQHLRLTAREGAIGLECRGKQPLVVGGVPCSSAEVRRLDLVEVRGVCSFLCVERPVRFASSSAQHAFGDADAHGIVGESPVIWELRRSIEFAGKRNAHVLVTGPSGTGKELVARAIHRESPRARRPIVSRNAATLPPSLLDAELYGNAANYPNAGMPERPGLIGQADGSTLFLDEIGELPSELQAHLLRVLDSGEYQRLGEARGRSSDFRFVAATNRPASSLKPDLAARLGLCIDVPGLGERPEDVPLLARYLVRRIARRDPGVVERYIGPEGEPRFSSELIGALALNEYHTHVRELESLLWRSLQSSPGAVLDCTHEVNAVLRPRKPSRTAESISRHELRAALERHGNVKEHVWRELGLSSRHSLLRLMKKLGET